jgi:hypothetical protein
MTVIVGILCSDGVVIGSDSAMAAGRAGRYTIERQEDVLKIEVIENDIITAVTGAMGLAQRFNDQVATTIRALREPFQLPQFAPSPLQQMLANKVKPGSKPFNVISAVEMGRVIAQTAIMDFQRTQSAYQLNHGWGLGALFAFVNADTPQLIDFDPIQFHPELKGLPDPLRADQDRIWRCVSWGAGQQLADSFLAHVYRLLFSKEVPTVDRAKLVVAWTVDHVRRYNVGLVGGKLQLAVLEKVNGTWSAHHADPGEIEQQVVDLEAYISEFRQKKKPDAAAKASTVDLHKELEGEKPAS